MLKLLTLNKFTPKIRQILIEKLQKDYYKIYRSELPVILLSGLIEKNIEILFIKKLFKANGWIVFVSNNLDNFGLLLGSNKQKNTVLISETNIGTIEVEVEATRGPKFVLTVMNKYIFDDCYLWPKSLAKIAYILEKIQSEYHLDKVNIQDIVGKIDLPQHTFDMVKGRMSSTIIDSTANTDLISIHSFLDTFEEIVNIYSHADFDSLEYQNSMVIAPKHTLILEEIMGLGDISIVEHGKILERLISFSKKYNDYLEEIYLVGDEWLKCDEQGFAKKDGVISYIRFDSQTFKVVNNASDLDTFLSDDLMRPHSWFWLKGSKKLTCLRFRLTK